VRRASKNSSSTTNKEKWSILSWNQWNYCPKLILLIIFIWLVLGAQKELCAQILREITSVHLFPSLGILISIFGKSHVDFSILVSFHTDGIRCPNNGFLKNERPKSIRIVLCVLCGNKGLKTVLETVVRSLIASIISEELWDKVVWTIHESIAAWTRKVIDWETKINSAVNKIYWR